MYTIDDIVHHTGIPESKAVEVCNLLSGEGYLIFNKETGRYRLTKDRNLLANIKELWKQCKDEHLFEQMCSKVEDIIAFGKPLALSEKGPGETVQDIGIPGLNIIFESIETIPDAVKKSGGVQKVPGLPSGHCLLIQGAPGTGKTTMGLQIALYLKHFRARFLTFEEDINQLINNFKGYLQKEDEPIFPPGWKKSDIKEVARSLIKIRTPSAWENPDVVLDELISILDRELPHLIVIDSVSRFRDLGGETKARYILRKLIRNLKCRRITAIFTGEDRGEETAFEEYEVDGIIHLKWAGDLLTLTVKKLRGLIAYKGPHSAAMMSVDDLELPQHQLISEDRFNKSGNKTPYLTVGLNVFPDISVFKEIKIEREDKPSSPEIISTGTGGLDDLLRLYPEGEKKGFKRGETILLVGSAGSGKTLLALNFMLDGYKSQKKPENTVWLNFEGDLGTLRFATSGFEGSHKSDFDKMLKLGKNNETGSRFEFIDFPPINLDLNKIVFTLEAIHTKYRRIDRLVIDSITELEKVKGAGQPAVKVFLTGLIQFLRDREITTVFVCRSDAFFKSIDKIEEQISSLVDLIICIRNFDVHNRIEKGIYIQKARGRYHDSKIIRMLIDKKEGIRIEDSGWDIENLLAGDTSNIETPRIFFKLFYENPAEEDINQRIINDFNKERYPGDNPKFTLVKKPSIYTEFWSFRGQFSAGHANTRVLSIADYVISAFRDNDRLAEIDKYIKSEMLQDIYGAQYLGTGYGKQKESEVPYIALESEKLTIDAIPCYHDYGIMLFKEQPYKNDVLEASLADFKKHLKGLADKINSDNDRVWKEAKYTWENLLELFINLKNKREKLAKKDGNLSAEIIPFAFPPLDDKAEFVAFFMELLWSYGGDIYHYHYGFKKKSAPEEGKGAFNDKIKDSILKEFICYYMERLKRKGKSTNESKKEVISSLLIENKLTEEDKRDKRDKRSSLITDFEQRFKIYGLDSKEIDIKEFKKWIARNLQDLNEEIVWAPEDSVLALNDKAFGETIKLILRLVHQGGVINPIEGEFRERAVLSRNWYSRISQLQQKRCSQCIIPDEKKCADFSDTDKEKCSKKALLGHNYNLLPIPLAKIVLDEKKKIEYFRSVTCLTLWSLVMLKNALSPEIGGNFIESMNAPEYYVERLRNRLGMPVRNLEIKKKQFIEFDQESYSIFDKTVENALKCGETIERFRKKRDDSKHSKEVEYAFVYRDFVAIKKTKEERLAFFDKHEDDFYKRAFFLKARQSRAAFYQLEQALHFQLRQLFMPYDIFREKYIYKKNIFEKTRQICEKEMDLKKESTDRDDFKTKSKKIKKDWKNSLKIIKKEFRLHVIFELLTYFFHEDVSGVER